VTDVSDADSSCDCEELTVRLLDSEGENDTVTDLLPVGIGVIVVTENEASCETEMDEECVGVGGGVIVPERESDSESLRDEDPCVRDGVSVFTIASANKILLLQ